MLSKEVCKKCYKDKWNTEFYWTVNQEIKWDEGIVLCPYKGGAKAYCAEYLHTAISGDIPEECPYGLEHVVNEK
jgi:hypothetical protein